MLRPGWSRLELRVGQEAVKVRVRGQTGRSEYKSSVQTCVCVCVGCRWAQFFICPLMIEDAVDREVEAVDSGESFFQRGALHQ